MGLKPCETCWKWLLHNLHLQCHLDKTIVYPTAGIADKELLVLQFLERQREVWECDCCIDSYDGNTCKSGVSWVSSSAPCAFSRHYTTLTSHRLSCFLLTALIRFLSLHSVPFIRYTLIYYVHYATVALIILDLL